MSNARIEFGGAGTQTSALAFGGYLTESLTEEYDGTSWTAGGNLNTARSGLGGTGLQTSALAFGSAPGASQATEEYDGTSWTAGGSLSTGRGYGASAGTQTAALFSGGNTATATVAAITESYNGTSWTVGGNMITARRLPGTGGVGTQTSAIAFGGETDANTPTTNATEEFTGGPVNVNKTISFS
jgi:hypothetical protein